MKKGTFSRVTRWALGLHGAYYLITGIWAIISLESFNRFVMHEHPGGAFEMHSIAAMAVVLGIAFIYAAHDIGKNIPLVAVAFGIALAIILPELYYLPRMEGFNLFWFDLVEEIVVAIIFGAFVWTRRERIF